MQKKCKRHNSENVDNIVGTDGYVCVDCVIEDIEKESRSQERAHNFKQGAIRVLRLDQVAKFFKKVGL